MLNFFEQPWTLTFIAIIALLVLLQFGSIFPEKRRWWQLLVPLFIAASAFGLDFAVRTDLEKIRAIIKTGIKAVQQEDCDAIEAIIAYDYRDSYHGTKADLMAHCRKELSRSAVEKNKKVSLLVELTPPQATAELTAWVRFDPASHIAQTYYKRLFLVEVKLHLKKQPDKSWQIWRAELLEIDRQPVNWRAVR